jgi:hypothetical protein
MTVYSVRNLRTMPTSNGEAFSCDILKDGKRIGFAENSGRGGCNTYQFPKQADQDEMTSHAMATLGDQFEVLDLLVVNLTVAAEMNRMRKVAFIIDGDDFDGLGQYRTFKSGVTPEMARQALLGHPSYKDKHPKMWDKKVGAFVAVA